MRSIRNSHIFKANQRLTERKSVVGSFSTFETDIYRDIFYTPHEEMRKCVEMYNRNSFAQSAINTMVDFIMGGEIVVKSKSEATRKAAQAHLDELDTDEWCREVIESTVKTGNGYLEIDYNDAEWKTPYKCYAIADSSRIYINCDEFGKPKKEKVLVTNPVTKEHEYIEKRNEEEYFVQRVEAGFRHPKAKWFDMSYHVGFQFKKFRIYGIPVNKRKIIHFRLNLGDTGIYGRSYMASALDDYESLQQIERSIAVIAKYKAVPRDIIAYGDNDNPATDDELDEFIIYLESLEKEESAIVNKPISRTSLSYAGQDINLDYMIQHINKKIIAGIAPDFMMGIGDQVNKASSQIMLISYILAIYTKRRLFLKPIEKYILKPFLMKNNLEKAWLEFGELDFETKAEKTNRVGALWVQNLLTFNRSQEMLGEPTIGDIGDVYYLEWQSSMMGDDSAFGFPSMSAPPEEETLPNNEPMDKVFLHNDPANRDNVQQGGKMPNDPYQKPTNVPKFLPKKDLGKPGSESESIKEFNRNKHTITKKNIDRLYNIEMPENYNLESERDFSGIAEKKDAEKHKEAKIVIHLDDDKKEDIKTKEISYKTLLEEFNVMFDEPRLTEIYYKELENGWRISFIKNEITIYCIIEYEDILNATVEDITMLSEEEIVGIVTQWKNRFLMKAIKEE